MTTIITAIVIGWIAGIVLFNIGSAITVRLFGHPTERFVIGHGPALLCAGRVELRLFPIGGHVRFGARGDGTSLEHASPLAILLPALAGPALLVGFAVLGGGSGMVSEVVRTWSQIVDLFLDPMEPLGIASALDTIMSERGLIGGIALTLTKFAGLNLLPLAVFSGGVVVAQLFRLATGRPIGEGAMQIWLKVSLVIFLAIVLLLLVKLVAHGL